MNQITLDTSLSITYHWCGKFIAPNSSWIHLTRNLTDYELMFITEGTLHIAAEEKCYTVNKGEYLLMPPTPYQHGVKSSYCEFYWLHFGYSQDATEKEPSDIYHRFSLLQQGSFSSPDRLFMLIKQLQDSDRRYHDSFLNSCLTGAILGELAQQTEKKPDAAACDTMSDKITSDAEKASSKASAAPEIKKDQLYSDIINYISWHISENLKCTQIAEYFGYNSKYLTTFFKKHSGISLKQYLQQEKMGHARFLLSETDTNTSEIGYQLGFDDPHNFSNAFKKTVGMSPTAYRELYTKRNVFDK